VKKLELFSLFDSKSFKSAKNKINRIINQITDYSEAIKTIINESLMPYFQTYFSYLLDAKYRTN